MTTSNNSRSRVLIYFFIGMLFSMGITGFIRDNVQDDKISSLETTISNLEDRITDIDQCFARKADPNAEQIPFSEPTTSGTETTNLLISLGQCNPASLVCNPGEQVVSGICQGPKGGG